MRRRQRESKFTTECDIMSSNNGDIGAEQYDLPIGGHVHVLYYRDVTNTAQILSLANTPPYLTVINPALMPSVTPVLCCAYKAALSKRHAVIKARHVHAELLYHLSPTNHIATAVTHLLPPSSATEVLIVAFDRSADEIRTIQSTINGTLTASSHLVKYFDSALAMKLYKIPSSELIHIHTTTDEYTNAILSRIAMK